METNRPKGINIIARGGRIVGFFALIGGIGGTLQNSIYFYEFFLGVALMISSSFMLKSKNWARNLFIFLMFPIMGFGVWKVVQGAHFSWVNFAGFSLTFLPVPLYCIYYLTPLLSGC
jgi:glucose dehydrogenase